MWYIYDFARKAWADAFTNAKTSPEIAQKPERFRDFPKVNKEYCIGCGACTVSCPSPNAIKIVIKEHVYDVVFVLKFALQIQKHWNVG